MNMTSQGMEAQTVTEARRRGLIASLMLLFAGFLVITGLAWQGVVSMVSTWYNISAYNHGFFIFPIALYLAWERRARLSMLTMQPFWPGLLVVIGFAFAWLLSRGASVQEGEQFAYVGMLQGLFLTVLGRKAYRAQLLPVLYLWLMVPTGTFLLPTLQAIATWLAVQLLELAGIPFFVEQFYLQLPSGLYFVAPGCAGLNFIFSSLALSIVYAELMYIGWMRKLAAILIAVGVAVLANGVRIFSILWLAEISGRSLAIVDDHILYGWGFFFVILLMLMWAGRFFSNVPPLLEESRGWDWAPRGVSSIRTAVVAGALSVASAAAVMGYGLIAFAEGTPQRGVSLAAFEDANGWALDKSDISLENYANGNADARGAWRYEKKPVSVYFSAAYYADQWEGHEAAWGGGIFRGKEKIIGRAAPLIALNGKQRKFSEQIMAGNTNNLIIWRWYCVGGYFTSDTLALRMHTAFRKLRMEQSPAAAFILISEDNEAARDHMAAFLQAAAASSGFMVMDSGGKAQAGLGCW